MTHIESQTFQLWATICNRIDNPFEPSEFVWGINAQMLQLITTKKAYTPTRRVASAAKEIKLKTVIWAEPLHQEKN